MHRFPLVLLLAACTPKDGGETGADVDAAPTVTFTSPVAGTVWSATELPTLVARVTDEDVDGLAVAWSSSLAGPLGGEETRNADTLALHLDAALPLGTQSLLVSVTDGAGQSASDEVSVEVVAPAGDAPSLTFTSPAEGAEIPAGSATALTLAVADDADPALVTLVWTGARGDSQATAGVAGAEVTPDALGDVVIEVTGTDGDGLSTTATRTLHAVAPDFDGDGHADVAWGGDDCDDADDSVFPGAGERCGGGDEDCDGLTDEDDPDLDPDSLVAAYTDADGDGYGDDATAVYACEPPEGTVALGGDCDDGDDARSPGAAERCDPADVDEDCDGLADDADDDAEGAVERYPDADHDGYGTDPVVRSCEGAEGALVDGDCDDGDAAVNPGADEVCNGGVDDDCDGLADDEDPDVVDASTWYTDGDGDGYGGAGAVACEAPTGAVADGGDCDDADAAVSPGAPDRCDDGVDQDCADGDAVCPSDTELYLYGASANTFLGWQLVVADVDLDGADDIVAAQYAESGSYPREGTVWVSPGPMRADRRSSTVGAYTGASDERLGSRLAPAGDLDGDGAGDLLLVAPFASDPDSGATYIGGVYLVSAPFDGGAIGDEATAVWWGQDASRYVNDASVADVNGDGIGDVAVGLRGARSGAHTAAGSFIVEYGPVHTGGELAVDAASVTFTGRAQDDVAGYRVLLGPDLDGDGQSDVFASAIGDTTGATAGGAVYAWWGVSGSAESFAGADAIWTGGTSQYAGTDLVAAGDLTGDGIDDVYVLGSSADSSDGAAWVLSGADAGGTQALSSAWMTITGEHQYELGTAVASFDRDGDGAMDVAVGAPGYGDDPRAPTAGLVAFFAATPGSFTLADAFATEEGYDAYDAFGCALGAGDIDYDGVDDLAVGTYTARVSAEQDGAVKAFLTR